jgi:hypothetical protein
MSNPKEKAAAMILKYTIILEYDFVSDLKWYPPNDVYRNNRIKKDAKRCALAAVDEILNIEHPQIIIYTEIIKNSIRDYFQDEYWNEVKKEIQKL